MGCLRRAGHLQNRVSSAKRVGHGFFRQRVGHPLPVHYQAVFVGAGRQSRFLQPATAPCGMQSLGFGLPVVESSRDANRGGRRMREFKANGHEFGLGVAGIVMVMMCFIALSSTGVFGDTYLPSIFAMTKMTKAPKRPPPPRRY